MNKYDLIIIGGGISGLSTAWYAQARNMRVLVLEANTIGQGASGGLVGAMAPHMPENWNAKKEYQFQSLIMARDFWPMIHRLSGLDTGYQQLGRWQGVQTDLELDKAMMRAKAAKTSWRNMAHWEVIKAQTPFQQARAVIYDTLSSQIFPRMAIFSLAQALRKNGVTILENHEVSDFQQGRVFVNNKFNPEFDQEFFGDHLILAGGHALWPLIRRYMGCRFGEGTKGQAMLIQTANPWHHPMITGDGYYLVPHTPHQIAIGSTSERYWQNRNIDAQINQLQSQVTRDFQGLQDHKIIEYWSGIRPRAYRPDPLIGPLEPGVYCHAGGFKTGFSFALKLSTDLIDMIDGGDPKIPNNFLPAAQRTPV